MTIDELKSHFVSHNDQLEFSPGESDIIECKKSIRIDANGCPRNFDDSLRAISALANNKGGMLLYGIEERTGGSGEKIWAAVGLPDKKFKNLDPGNVSMLISDSMMPFVQVHPFSFEVNNSFFAGFNVDQANEKPVLSIKNNQSTKEGCIYFRYPGESKPIKHGELRSILNSRDNMQLRKISKIFSTIVALSDSENLADIQDHLEELPIQMQSRNSPTTKIKLKDGEASENEIPIIEQGVAVSDEDIIENFIYQRNVKNPISYVSHYCQIARVYLPIYFYLNQAGYKTPETRTKCINELNIRKTGHVEKVVERVESSGGLKSFRPNPEQVYIELLNEEFGIDFFDPNIDTIRAIRNLCRVSKSTVHRKNIFNSLQSAWKFYKANPDSRFFNELCYATCNIDYWFYE